MSQPGWTARGMLDSARDRPAPYLLALAHCHCCLWWIVGHARVSRPYTGPNADADPLDTLGNRPRQGSADGHWRRARRHCQRREQRALGDDRRAGKLPPRDTRCRHVQSRGQCRRFQHRHAVDCPGIRSHRRRRPAEAGGSPTQHCRNPMGPPEATRQSVSGRWMSVNNVAL
jgi:hypothetical protein